MKNYFQLSVNDLTYKIQFNKIDNFLNQKILKMVIQLKNLMNGEKYIIYKIC
jgi:hypothetical protein